jgi:hypothetical protein
MTTLSTYSKFDEGDIGNSGLGNHEPPSLQPWLNLSDFHLFEPMKVHLGGQKFQPDYELRCGVLNWLHNQDKTIYGTGINNFPGWWKKYVSVNRECL